MNKKIYALFALMLLGTTMFITSCSNDDDDDTDQNWITFQDAEFQKVATNTAQYTKLKSQSDNGYVYWQPSTVITDSDVSSRITAQGTPEFTDTVVIRYEGWYVDQQGKKYIFDSTESPSLSNTSNPNKTPVQFAVNGLIDGFSTLLQDMKVQDERLVVIPQQLGYGSSKTSYIPAYTTLWFRVKLVKIIPLNGRN